MHPGKSSTGLIVATAGGRRETAAGAESVACPDCGLGQRLPPFAVGHLASCRRCRCTLAANTGYGLDAVLAVALTALILLLFAYLSPLASLHAYGETRQSWVYSGV